MYIKKRELFSTLPVLYLKPVLKDEIVKKKKTIFKCPLYRTVKRVGD